MSQRQSQRLEEAKNTTNLSKKRGYVEYRDSLENSYQTEKESRSSRMNKKYNDIETLKKASTDPKQAGKYLASDSNSRGLLVDQKSKGYQTEGCSKSVSTLNNRSNRGKGRDMQRIREYDNQDLSQKDSDDLGKKGPKSATSRRGGRSKKGSDNDSIITHHQYGTRNSKTQKATEVIETVEREDFIIEIDNFLNNKIRKYPENATKHFQLADLGQYQGYCIDLDDTSITRHTFRDLKLRLNQSARNLQIINGDGIKIRDPSKNFFSGFKEVFIKEIGAKIKNGKVIDFYIEYYPILSKQDSKNDTNLEEAIKNLTEMKIASSKGELEKFVVMNYPGKNLVDDYYEMTIEQLAKHWFNPQIYHLKLAESTQMKVNLNALKEDNECHEFVKFVLDYINIIDPKQLNLYQNQHGQRYGISDIIIKQARQKAKDLSTKGYQTEKESSRGLRSKSVVKVEAFKAIQQQTLKKIRDSSILSDEEEEKNKIKINKQVIAFDTKMKEKKETPVYDFDVGFKQVQPKYQVLSQEPKLSQNTIKANLRGRQKTTTRHISSDRIGESDNSSIEDSLTRNTQQTKKQPLKISQDIKMNEPIANIKRKKSVDSSQDRQKSLSQKSSNKNQVVMKSDKSSDSESAAVQRRPTSRNRRAPPKSVKKPQNKTIVEESQESEQIHNSEGELQAKNNEMASANSDIQNDYDRACDKLQLNAIPDTLPCRDKERTIIEEYLMSGLQNNGSSSSLYVSGMPGTGKTATTLEIIRKLRAKKNLNFKFLHINAMSLTNPNLVYTVIHEHITGRRINPTSAASFLDDFFKRKDKFKVLSNYLSKNAKGSRITKTKTGKSLHDPNDIKKDAEKMRIILIDELDALVTKKQTLLYNLFDWPCHQNSRLLVISIANTMDLPERMQPKILSRIGNNRLVYEPYNREQIQMILQSRLQGIPIFDQKSIQLVAAKVSSYSGDIRRSLQVTKRAVEICRDHYIKKCEQAQNDEKTKVELIQVTYNNVNEAFNELYNSKTCQVLRSLRNYEVLVIFAIYLELITHKADRVLLDKVQERCDSMLQVLDWRHHNITTNVFREIVKRLHSFGLVSLTVESNKITENVHLQLFVYYDEIKQAFENHEVYDKFEGIISMYSGSGKD